MYQKQTKESEIEDYLTSMADARQCICWKFKSPGRSGVPDRILIKNGKVIFAELKRPGEKPRPLQAAVIKILRSHGADVRIIDSKKQVDMLFREI